MIIIKKGNLHTHKFRCHHCGCEFVANELEYKSDRCDEPTGRSYFDPCTSEEKPQIRMTQTYMCVCPCCKINVEDSFTTTYKCELDAFNKSYFENFP